jgi:hypothetical protein
MTALTYDDTRVSTPESKIATKIATKAAPKKSVVTEAPRQGFFARLLTAILEARLRQAEREIRLHTRLLPRVRGEQAESPSKSTGSDTPRGGW